MHLIYSHNYATARAFAQRNEFMPGDWKWIQDADIVRQYPRADVYKVGHWGANPHRDKIAEAAGLIRVTGSGVPEGEQHWPYSEIYQRQMQAELGDDTEVRLRIHAPPALWVNAPSLGPGWLKVPLYPHPLRGQKIWNVLGWFLAIGLLSTASAWIFVSQLNQPLKRLVYAARQLGQGPDHGFVQVIALAAWHQAFGHCHGLVGGRPGHGGGAVKVRGQQVGVVHHDVLPVQDVGLEPIGVCRERHGLHVTSDPRVLGQVQLDFGDDAQAAVLVLLDAPHESPGNAEEKHEGHERAAGEEAELHLDADQRAEDRRHHRQTEQAGVLREVATRPVIVVIDRQTEVAVLAEASDWLAAVWARESKLPAAWLISASLSAISLAGERTAPRSVWTWV